MIIEYLRPTSIDEALKLISRSSPISIPVGGGSSIRRKARKQDIAVVDLQALNLNSINISEEWIEIGAMATLNTIEAHSEIPDAIRDAILLEGTANTRNQVTLGGRLIAFSGRSALICSLIAADAMTIWDEDNKLVPLGEWLALPDWKPGKLLLAIKFSRKVPLAFEVVNRTKLDLPILCVSAARWKSGRVRVAVGGFGKCPQMVFDGLDAEGVEKAAENACTNATDFHGSSEYRRAMAIVLVKRCLMKLQV
jgi:putative selenate reductase FAD-binding subunit